MKNRKQSGPERQAERYENWLGWQVGLWLRAWRGPKCDEMICQSQEKGMLLLQRPLLPSP